MTSKERSRLKGLAMNINATFQVGKDMVTPQFTEAVRESLEKNEIIKLSVLNNCADDPNVIAAILAERTGSEVVQVIGKKIVLYSRKTEERKKKEQKAREKKIADKKTVINKVKSGNKNGKK